jgi:hypothetical protein
VARRQQRHRSGDRGVKHTQVQQMSRDLDLSAGVIDGTETIEEAASVF